MKIQIIKDTHWVEISFTQLLTKILIFSFIGLIYATSLIGTIYYTMNYASKNPKAFIEFCE